MKNLGRRNQELQESKGKEDKMNKDIRVMLVDDQELVRYGLRRMLEQEEDMEVVDDCANAEEAFSKMARLHPDVVLMDTQMPGMNGIEATYALKRNGWDYDGDVIVLAESVDYRGEALEAGAARYLLKDITRAELVQAIRDVYWSKQSLDNREDFVEEVVELVVPPPANAASLLRLMFQLEERLNDVYDHVSIMRMIGSWDWGTVITISLGLSSFADLSEKLNRMPDVEKVKEVPIARSTFASYLKKFGVLPRPSISPSKRIQVTLKETDMARQELVSVLN